LDYKPLLAEISMPETGAVISVGKIDAGVRSNVIPEELTMNGTIRTLNSEVQDMIHKRVKE
jgi:metal-dependent amidase/aminoacylase/carboxypeptidase family protein